MLTIPRPALALALAALLAAPAISQDNPDRPPWAQKKKKSDAKSQPSSESAQTTSQSDSHPAGDPALHPPVNPGDAPGTTAAGTKTDNDDQNPSAQRHRIRVDVNLVTVLASVLDEKNRPAPDLPVEAFQVLEEGVLQKIEYFESETKLPLDIALMIDTSMSTHKEFAFEQEAAAHFIRQVLRAGDELAVYGFDETVTQYAKFSSNVGVLQDAVRRIPSGSGTSIYDAVLLASHALAGLDSERRRVIILVTDAGETTSRTDFEHARREAVRAGTLLYTIVIRPVKNESGRNTAGEHALETITDNTGGALFFPDSIQDLGLIFDRIDRELRTQYRFAYYPNPRGPANTYRKIEVKVLNGDYHIRHRSTYLTGPE
jgi:Ca-activated chloride channel family protein